MDSHFTVDPRSILIEVKEHLMLKRPQHMTTAPKPNNARKYCVFYKQKGHTTAKCRDVRKAFYELANTG